MFTLSRFQVRYFETSQRHCMLQHQIPIFFIYPGRTPYGTLPSIVSDNKTVCEVHGVGWRSLPPVCQYE